MQKQLTFDVEARQAVARGVDKLARAVISTLGPKGRNAVLDKSWGGPTVTKDGATVAKEIELRDKNENLGAQLVKEAATKTADRAGDGTTTATLLASSLFQEAMRHLAVGADPAALIRGMRRAAEHLRSELGRKAMKVRGNPEAIKAVATIASNNDPQIGRILADAFKKVGEDGVITIDEGRGLETEVKIVEGMQFDRGFLSPHFATDEEAFECVQQNPFILIHEEKISSAQKLLPLLEAVKKAGRPLLIVAENVEGEALATLVVNKVRGILDVCAVKAPGYGDRRKEMLRDIAVLTGGTAVMKDSGIDLEKVGLDLLGKAKKVLVDNNNTTILQGAGTRAAVEARAAQIRRAIEETTSDYDREKLEERLAKLVGGIAQIQVGAATETEVKEIKARFEDARDATRAAIEEGVLPGGGTAFLRLAQGLTEAVPAEGDEAVGVAILARALEQPARQIARNAGLDGSVVVRNILQERKFAWGYNALTDTYGDMIEMGILDPTKVARTALENAVSVAATLMTTECLVVEAPKKEEDEASDEGMDDDF